MLGKPVADFSAASTGGNFRLKDERGSKLVLCFYPNQYKSFSKGPRHRAQHFRRRRKGSAGERMARGESAGPRPGGIELC
jgi:peroxiredoxin